MATKTMAAKRQMADVMHKIDGVTLSSQASDLRQKWLESPICISSEVAVLQTQSWQETEGQPLDIRYAKMLKKVCEGLRVAIFPGQKLVGGYTESRRGVYLHPEFTCFFLKAVLAQEGTLVKHTVNMEPGVFSPEDRAGLREAVEFWDKRTPGTRIMETVQKLMGSWYFDLLGAGGCLPQDETPYDDHCPVFERVVEEGLRSHIKEAQGRIQTWQDDRRDDVEKLDFWQASIISCEAAIALAHRYADKAKEMAATEKDPEWRAELLEIARICEWVPENPARTFREAMQSIMLVYTADCLQTSFQPDGWGRMDRYLYPLFQRDLAEGRLSLEEAADMLVDFYLFNNNQEWVIIGTPVSDFLPKGQLVSVALGGTDEKGEDVCNELTYLFLHVMGLVKTPEPHLCVGWHKNAPDWLLRKALETNWKTGGGVPHFQNCDEFVDLMVRRGVSLENARNWISIGCSQITDADQRTGLRDAYLNVTLCVDLALHNGIASQIATQIGPKTGDPRTFKTFEEFYRAFQTQLEDLFTKVLWHDNVVDQLRAMYFRQPLTSTLLPGPLEKGMDMAIGGLRSYKMYLKKDRGYVPAGDSLIAIKKLVYEEKKLSMAELLEAIDSNFAGKRGEEIRQMCLAAPKYGNDIDEVDFMVRDIAKFGGNIVTSTKNIWGDYYVVNRNGESWHTLAGRMLAALPNGRRAGEFLADGSLSPMQGMDRNGPTAVLNSAVKANFKEQSPAGIMTLRFSAPIMATPEMREKLVALTESFMEQGGTYVQYNILDAKQMREAKLHPEKYRDLLVRVGGYSAFFVTLNPDQQDELISRTEQSLC